MHSFMKMPMGAMRSLTWQKDRKSVPHIGQCDRGFDFMTYLSSWKVVIYRRMQSMAADLLALSPTRKAGP